MRWWPAPAKINLFLHVTGRRADGYHDLQTVFQLLDWCDDVGVEITADGAITRVSGPESIPPERDLTVRAARLLAATTGVPLGARLTLRKRLPSGGGLGGGSSDAATVLRVLNHLWDTRLSIPRLAELGLTLGADVPVFVYGSSAWGEGRGEQLHPVTLPERWFLVIHPGVAISTAEIFQAAELTRNSPLITIRAFSPAETRNDCERVVRARYPEVAAALDWLARFAPSRLTGTGSCIFAAFATAAEAERIAARVPDRWSAHVARGLQQSPLQAALPS
jgi:4-diphosphocytidyl-2-C-methyl-D-erythritol kinase